MTQSRGNYNALTWLQDELQKSLAASLQSVQTYIDDPQQSESLSRCVEQLKCSPSRVICVHSRKINKTQH